MSVKPVDLEVTHGLLNFHNDEIRRQLLSEKPNWDVVIRSLRRIENECATSIQLAQKLKGAMQ